MKRAKEIPVKDIRADGSLKLMTPKEAKRWRKTLKTKLTGVSPKDSSEKKEEV